MGEQKMIDRALLPEKSRGGIPKFAAKLVEELFYRRRVSREKTILNIAEHGGLAGLAGEKGIHHQRYEAILPTPTVDGLLQQLVTKLWNKGGIHYPNIVYSEDGHASMKGLGEVKSGASYLRLVLPTSSTEKDGRGQYINEPARKYIFYDIPVDGGPRSGDLLSMLTLDFLNNSNQPRSNMQNYDYGSIKAQYLDEWTEKDEGGEPPPAVVIRFGKSESPDIDEKLGRLLRDPRIPLFLDVDYHESQGFGLTGLNLDFQMGHIQYDAAPIKSTIEEIIGVGDFALTGNQKNRAIELADDWFPPMPAQPEVIGYEPGRIIDPSKIDNLEQFSEARHAALQKASFGAVGVESLATLIGRYEHKYTLEWSPDFFALIKEVERTYEEEGLSIPTSTYLALAMRTIYGGGVLVPVNPEGGGRMELSPVPTTNDASALLDLFLHFDHRLDLQASQFPPEAETEKLIGNFRAQFVKVTGSIKDAIKAYQAELARAKTGEGGAITNAVRQLGGMRQLVQDIVGLELAGQITESLNPSISLSTLGRLAVPDGVYLKGHFETAGEEEIDQAIGNMGSELQLKWFMHDKMGMFWLCAYLLKKGGMSEFARYLKEQKRLKVPWRGRQVRVDMDAARTVWEEYSQAMDSSATTDGMLIPEQMLGHYGRIMQDKKAKREYQRGADAFLSVLTAWIKEKADPNLTWGGNIEAQKFARHLPKLIERAVEWRVKSVLYAAGTYLVAMQLAAESGSFANWEKEALGKYDNRDSTLGIPGGYAILEGLRKSMNEAAIAMNNVAAGRG